MPFSGKFGANLTNAGRTLSQKAKNFSDSTALQREMNAEKRNVQQKYSEIGQLYYEKFRDDPGADFFAEIESITASTKRIEEIQSEIQDVQARKPELVQVPDTPKSSVQPSAMVCMQCGSTYDTAQTFCSACGQKLTPQYPTAAAASLAPAQKAEDVQTREDAISLEKPSSPSPEAAAPAQPESAGVRPRFCTKCGVKADQDSLFCALCGGKLPE